MNQAIYFVGLLKIMKNLVQLREVTTVFEIIRLAMYLALRRLTDVYYILYTLNI